jgi:nitrite reductase/ring-hydroxylating ferredoxin subunit
MKQPLIAVSEIPQEGTTVVDFFGRDVHVYLVEGKPRAAVGICMHLGGPLSFKAETCSFTCAWQNAEFSASDGKPISGPAPSNSRLMFLPTRVENGVLNYVWGE